MNTVHKFNISVTGLSEEKGREWELVREEREREEKKPIYIDTMFKNFLKLIKDIKLQIQEAIQTLSKNKENQIQAYLTQTAKN